MRSLAVFLILIVHPCLLRADERPEAPVPIPRKTIDLDKLHSEELAKHLKDLKPKAMRKYFTEDRTQLFLKGFKDGVAAVLSGKDAPRVGSTEETLPYAQGVEAAGRAAYEAEGEAYDSVFETIDKIMMDESSVRFKNGADLLHRAVGSGDGPKLKFLLSLKIDPDQRGSHRSTPLLAAISSHHTELVEILLEHRASLIKAYRDDGASPLHVAVQNKDFRQSTLMIELLLEHGADVNAVDEEGKTALHYAEDEETRELLIEAKSESGKKKDGEKRRGEE